MKRLIILFIFSVTVSAQTFLIEGKILNSENHQPVQFCNISIENKNLFTSSDKFGNFSLQGNLQLSDKIIFSSVGFEKKILSIKEFLDLNNKVVVLENKLYNTQAILVKGIISSEGQSPISFAKLKKEDFLRSYTSQDIPEILSYLPSMYFYSENGNGIGYNYLSIRGFDQRRISVSINGIPQNDPEDQNVYWIDFPDLIENTDLIQVQRGTGSGIVGYPAIGGSINIITSKVSAKPKLELTSSLGSFNTRKLGINFTSGLIENKYSFSAKLSQILSSGYRNLSWTNLKSYYLSAVRFDENLTTQINMYGGPISDGLSYTGLPKFAIKDKELRKQNYSYWESNENKITYATERKPEEIENFSQPHFELINQYKFNDKINFNSSLFLVIGNGFFDYDGSWADTSYFRLTHSNGIIAKQNPSNALIRAMVENKQWGWIPKAIIQHDNGELIVGGEFRFHSSLHWGSINYANELPEYLQKDYRYYQYNGAKDILNLYVNESYSLNEKISLLGEIQLAYNKYRLYNEKFLSNEFSVASLFLNSRMGVNYKFTDEISGYLSVASVSREPRLKNYYDAAESSGGEVPQFNTNPDGSYNFNSPLVKPEKMFDIELGSYYNSQEVNGALNGYFMIFNDEIVKKGQLDRFGQPVTGNMDKTLHYGIEGTFNYKLNENFEIVFNSSFSKNFVYNGSTFVKTKDKSGKKVIAQFDLKNNPLSGFPSTYSNLIFRFNYKNTFAQLTAKYIGDFYTDNYGNKLIELLNLYPSLTSYSDNKVDSYFVMNLYLSQEFNSDYLGSSIKLFLQINNLTNALYATNGIGGEFFPAADRNYQFGVKISL